MEADRETALEALIRRDRAWVLTGVIAITLLAWLYLVPTAVDMYGAMTGPARWMMSTDQGLTYWLLMFAMWAVMMAGMMLPSAAPTFLLYGSMLRKSAEPAPAIAAIYAFATGYLLVWTVFSLLATALQWLLVTRALLSPMMITDNPVLGAALLIAAGLYQTTPPKQACLTLCRSPVHFIATHWRPGTSGALRMGAEHGLYCVGCCWALMLLLFFGGVMNLGWIAGLTLFVLLEKRLPLGERGGRWAGAVMVAGGVALLVSVYR